MTTGTRHLWQNRPWSRAGRLLPLLPLWVGGLGLTRLLYELSFPRLWWLGRAWAALPLSALAAMLVWAAVWARRPTAPHPLALLPLLLNALYLVTSDVNLVHGGLAAGAALWLTAVCLLAGRLADRARIGVWLAWAALLPVYLATMPTTVGRADTFEFQVVAPRLGIAHPTGYPLYLLLGKLWTTLLPLPSTAWRLNAGTAVLALLAVALVFLAGQRLPGRSVTALLGAVALGLTPTFWSQAIEAEVYSLHALIVAGALLLMVNLVGYRPGAGGPGAAKPAPGRGQQRRALLLAGLIGLGLTNHLTTLFLLPPAGLALWLAGFFRPATHPPRAWPRLLLRLASALLLPLILYAYLPLRWAAVNGEPMGVARFVDWVIGGRFQDALQWRAWLQDPTRYAIVGRLFLAEWGWFQLALCLLGAGALIRRRPDLAAVLGLTWFGFSFYALNYYVPDLAVFLIPAHVVLALCWAAGAAAVMGLAARLAGRVRAAAGAATPAAATLLLLPVLLAAQAAWPAVDRASEDGLATWGRAVLGLPLAPDAAILADSEKIAPLFYLQQAEGMRPDLDILVLPDEAAYREALAARLEAGQVVYLARFLPGLAGSYHLRSLGPLTEVSRQPLARLPAEAAPADLAFGNARLRGFFLHPAAFAPRTTAVTLYWQAPAGATEPWQVYLRWQGEPPLDATGRLPANDTYPLSAWRPGEVVPDFHLLPWPVTAAARARPLQVALAPAYTPAADLPWQTVTTVALPPTTALPGLPAVRALVGNVALTGAAFPAQARPGANLPVTLAGAGPLPVVLRQARAGTLQLALAPAGPGTGEAAASQLVTLPPAPAGAGARFATAASLAAPPAAGRYVLTVSQAGAPASCGWLLPLRPGCVLGEVAVSGVALPPDAVNFDDKIALLDVSLAEMALTPGGRLSLTLTWQSLAPLRRDYTVFVQVLDQADRIVGQVDSWPVQGTHPTSGWTSGEVVVDPVNVQLTADLAPGPYRLIVGWYLLADLQRLPVLDAAGAPVDDRVVVPGLQFIP